MAEVTWSALALRQLAALGNFVAQDSEVQAGKLVTRLFLTTERLRSFPQSGRIVPEQPDYQIREVIVGDYRVMYRTDGDDVTVVAVVHGRRLFRLHESNAEE